MLDTGTKISGAAHLGLIGLVVFGVGFDQEPLPFSSQQVSLISAQEYAALTVQGNAPDVAETPAAIAAPEETATPDAPSVEDSRPESAPVSQPQPAPEAEVLPEAEIEPPSDDVDASEDVAVLVVPEEPITSLPQSPAPRPRPRPIDRVAPAPVAAPPPDAEEAPTVQEEVAPDEAAEEQQEEQEQQAPEAATDRIVTEADDTSTLAPTSAPRPPRNRPSPPVRTAQTPEEPAEPVIEASPEPQEDTPNTDQSDAVAAALSEALQNDAPSAPVGPPLTSGEKDALRVAVQQCWNVGSLSTAALATTVIVAVDMAPDGKPVTSSIRMISSEGGSSDAARQAYEAARRAIIRCGARGFDLPSEKYAQWQEIEMVFNPERMRVR